MSYALSLYQSLTRINVPELMLRRSRTFAANHYEQTCDHAKITVLRAEMPNASSVIRHEISMLQARLVIKLSTLVVTLVRLVFACALVHRQKLQSAGIAREAAPRVLLSPKQTIFQVTRGMRLAVACEFVTQLLRDKHFTRVSAFDDGRAKTDRGAKSSFAIKWLPTRSRANSTRKPTQSVNIPTARLHAAKGCVATKSKQTLALRTTPVTRTRPKLPC